MKLRFAGCVYVAALLIGAATGAFAQEKTFELKLAHWVPPSHPLQKALEEWGVQRAAPRRLTPGIANTPTAR
jgi:TRAP-type C4-dicarboxylate transport system substrate-binding protein